jgi:hypothetical protein
LWANQEIRINMTKNMTRKGLAFGAGLALVASGLATVPAVASAGDLSLAPTSGAGTTAFATDTFSLTSAVKTAVINPATLSYRIENPDQNQLRFVISAGANTAKVFGYKASGEKVTVISNNDATKTITIDFEDLDITSVVFHTLGGTPATDSRVLTVALDEADTNNSAAGQGADAFDYGDLLNPTSITVQAWVETQATPNYATVDNEFASEVVPVTFVDPSSVSVISKIERFEQGLADSGLNKATASIDHYLDLNTVALGIQADAGKVVDGVTLVIGDTIMVDSVHANNTNGTYTVSTTTLANGTLTALTTADFILVKEGTDNAGKVIQGDIAGNTFVDYSATDTFDAYNAGGNNFLGGSIDFSNSAINLNQVDLSKWRASVTASNTDDLGYFAANYLRTVKPAGLTVATQDALGRLIVQVPVADVTADEGVTYSFAMKHSGDTVAPVLEFSSPGYQVIAAPTGNLAVKIKATPTSATDASLGTVWSSGYPVAIRNGVGTVTYKAQTLLTNGTTSDLTANVPVMAVVTAGANLPKGETLQVSGATETVTAGQTKIVNGLTDSKGNWSVSVASSDKSSAGAAYSIEFFVLKAGTNPDAWDSTSTANSALYNADYASGSLAAGGFTADATVLSGSKPTVSFAVEDQFGQALSASSTNKAYSVELKAPSKTDLEQFVAVVDGKATFTFDNFLTAGTSSILTARLYTGTSTSPSYVSTATLNITLYNANTVAGVNAPAEVTGVVVNYDDFITGTASSTNVAPTDGSEDGTGDDFVINGTVVDSNGAGVPGAPVTLAGTGFQFVKNAGTVYSIDSISFAANEAGAFSVRGWTHVASATGNLVTVTSGDQTETIKVKSAMPAGNGSTSVDNLTFSWDFPTSVVVNTTYAVTATLTDKWANPLAGASLNFNGYAAAQFNASSSAVGKTTDKNGQATVYLRSLKDVTGLAAVGVTFVDYDVNGTTTDLTTAAGAVRTDVEGTVWDESLWTNTLEAEISFLTAAQATSADQKVNVGTFKGFVALYAKGYEGQKMSAIVAGKWIVVESLASDFERVVRFTGAGYTITTKLYIDGEQVGDAFTTLTK